MKNKIFVTAFLVFVIVFLYMLSGVFSDLNSWNVVDQPAEVAKIIKCMVFGLVAVCFALGIDIGPIIKGALSVIPGTFPDQKPKE